jgi:hypothetical protein
VTGRSWQLVDCSIRPAVLGSSHLQDMGSSGVQRVNLKAASRGWFLLVISAEIRPSMVTSSGTCSLFEPFIEASGLIRVCEQDAHVTASVSTLRPQNSKWPRPTVKTPG